ncbi:MAG: zinc ABC transporter solute-binding protein [Spirulinaceae cyanobacterium SM2_1_0]|nr:zinc ABC transporter solute-binding protein [Spirulinaceae cyanobacterium SM2_1_0]
MLTQRHIGRTLASILGLGLLSCAAPDSPPAADPPAAETDPPAAASIVATDTILCDLIQQLAAETIELTCLMEPGQDPHTYQPTPSARRALEQADLVFHGGYQIAPGLEGVITATVASSVAIAVYEEAVPEPILAEHHHHDHGDESHADDEAHDHDHAEDEAHADSETGELEPDPHVWHDVANVIAAIDIIATRLSQLNPDQAERYQQNAATLTAELQRLDAWVLAQIETIPREQRVLVTTHDAFNYYAAAYGLTNTALQGISTDDAPSAARIKELTETVATTQVPMIFVEATANPKALETVAREAGIQVAAEPLFTGSLGEAGSEQANYVQAIAYNTCTIVTALGGQCQPFSD